jgi:hypothetical protein
LSRASAGVSGFAALVLALRDVIAPLSARVDVVARLLALLGVR